MTRLCAEETGQWQQWPQHLRLGGANSYPGASRARGHIAMLFIFISHQLLWSVHIATKRLAECRRLFHQSHHSQSLRHPFMIYFYADVQVRCSAGISAGELRNMAKAFHRPTHDRVQETRVACVACDKHRKVALHSYTRTLFRVYATWPSFTNSMFEE